MAVREIGWRLHDCVSVTYRKVGQKPEVIRILKRYVAREVYHYLPRG